MEREREKWCGREKKRMKREGNKEWRERVREMVWERERENE